MPDIEKQTTYSIEEAAEVVGRSTATIRRHCQSGKLKAVGGGKGSTWQISRVELADWWKRQGGGRLFEQERTRKPGHTTIVEIMPADGWHAAYERADGTLEVHPLISWALFEDEDGMRYVDGISDEPVSTASGESEVGNFLCYLPADANAEEYAAQWRTRQ